MAEGDFPKGGSNVGNFLKQSTAGLPNWAWILVVGAGIAAAYFVPKFLGTQTGQANSATSGTGLGLAVDPTTGLPYAVEGLVPGGANAGGGNTTTTGTTATTTTTFQARQKVTDQNNPAYQFDQNNPGVPIRSAPNIMGTILGYLPFGATITTTGSAITGGSNFGISGQGTTLWYPVQGGYVSAYDLIATQAQSSNVNFVTWPYANANVYNGATNG